MGLLKKLARMFDAAPAEPVYWVRARCHRCGEVVQARVNLNNDLSVDYDQAGEPHFFCHKVLMGEGRCFQRIDVELTFDANRRLQERSISGGQFVDD
jgi:hypothetical protein